MRLRDLAIGESAVKEPTYWVAFCYTGKKPKQQHCTHKYFGTQTPEDVDKIKTVLTEWFYHHPFREFSVNFDKEEWFGKDKDERVLVPQREPLVLTREYGKLRKQLDKFNKDWHPHYSPHVTSKDSKSVNEPFDRYSLCCGDNEILTFKGVRR